MSKQQIKDSRGPLRTWTLIVATILISFIVVSVLGAHYKALKLDLTIYHLIRAVVILVAGLVISHLLKTRLQIRSRTTFSQRQQTIVGFSARLILYFGLALAVLAALGVGLSSFVFGGAFLTVIVGLAGQSMFANILGGVWLVMFQPFQVGDTISFVTWQYPVLMPSYPHEALKPTYNGRVTDINLMYTSMIAEDGDPMVFPNGIIAQSAIANRSKAGFHRIRTRFDVPAEVDPSLLIVALENELGQTERPPQIELVDLNLTSYSIRVTVWSQETEESVRHRNLTAAWRILDRLNSSSATSNPPDGEGSV